jgi:hypothetical protein
MLNKVAESMPRDNRSLHTLRPHHRRSSKQCTAAVIAPTAAGQFLTLHTAHHVTVIESELGESGDVVLGEKTQPQQGLGRMAGPVCEVHTCACVNVCVFVRMCARRAQRVSRASKISRVRRVSVCVCVCAPWPMQQGCLTRLASQEWLR